MTRRKPQPSCVQVKTILPLQLGPGRTTYTLPTVRSHVGLQPSPSSFSLSANTILPTYWQLPCRFGRLGRDGMREVRYKKSAKNREIVDNQFFFFKKITCLCVSPQFCGIQFQLNQRRERERERRWEGKNGGFAPPRRGGGGRGPPHRGGRLHRRRHQLLRLGPKPRIRPRRLPGSPRSPPFSRVAVLNQGGKERFLLGFMEKTGPKVGFWHGQIRRLIKDFGIVSCE